jgi:hypothetical protein
MADYQQAGAGGIIFMGLLQSITLPMSYEQRRITYRGVYSAIIAKLQLDDKQDGSIPIPALNGRTLDMIVGGTKLLLDQAYLDYNSSFESHSTTSKLENEYCELLAQIFDNLWLLAIQGKMIERVMVIQDEV